MLLGSESPGWRQLRGLLWGGKPAREPLSQGTSGYPWAPGILLWLASLGWEAVLGDTPSSTCSCRA